MYSSFARFRVKSLIIKFFAQPTAGASGIMALGILDDAGAEGEQPTTFDGVSELRCSAINFVSETIPTEFIWKPLDSSKWYYGPGGVTGSDTRLVYPGALYSGSSNSGQPYFVVIDYVLVFAGAAL
jgi:hypothetical protein